MAADGVMFMKLKLLTGLLLRQRMKLLAGLLVLVSLLGLYTAVNRYYTRAGLPGPAYKAPALQQNRNILLLGIDSPDGQGARPDLIMLLQIKPGQETARIISVPRDTRVWVDGVGYTKINHANAVGAARGGEAQGTQLTSQAVSNLLGIKVNNYVKLEVRGFSAMIDALGGLDLELPGPVKLTDYNKTLPAGKQHLNGEDTLKLVQERYSLKGGDFDRQRNQFMVLKALSSKFSSSSLAELTRTINLTRKSLIATDLSTGEMADLALIFQEIEPEDLTYYQVPGQNAYAFDPLLKTRLYYWEPNIVKLRTDLNQ